MTTYTKFAVRGIAVILLMSLFAALLGYVVRIALARNLALEEFGLFYAVFAFLGMFGAFKSLGFDKALIKFIPEFVHNKQRDFIKSSIIFVSFIQLVTNSIILIIVYIFSNFLAVNFFNNSQAGIILRLMAIAFFIDSFSNVLKFAFQGFKKMLYFSVVDLVRMLLILAIIMIGFKLNFGLMSPVYAYIFAPLVLIIIFSVILIRRVFPDFFKAKFLMDKALVKKISGYSIFILATTVGGVVLYYTDILALTYFTDLKIVALYSVALPTAKILLFIPRAVGELLWPLTTELWIKKENKILREGIESLYKYSIIIIMPLAFMMFSFTELLLTVLYGKDYVLASASMRILVIGMVFAVLYSINVSFFSGIGKPQIVSKIVYSAAIFNLIANLILIPIIGIIGAALATAFSYFIMALIGLVEIRKFIEITFPVYIWAKSLLAGILFTLVIWLLKGALFLNVWLETFIILSTSGIVYIALLFLLKIIDIKEIKSLYTRIVK